MKISLRRRHAQTGKNGASSHQTNYIEIFSEIVNLEGHQNHCVASKVTAVLLNELILRTGGVALGRVCAYFLALLDFYHSFDCSVHFCLSSPPNFKVQMGQAALETPRWTPHIYLIVQPTHFNGVTVHCPVPCVCLSHQKHFRVPGRPVSR